MQEALKIDFFVFGVQNGEFFGVSPKFDEDSKNGLKNALKYAGGAKIDFFVFGHLFGKWPFCKMKKFKSRFLSRRSVFGA